MNDNPENTPDNLSRRKFIKTASMGAGVAAIASLSPSEAKAISPNQVPKWDYVADVWPSVGRQARTLLLRSPGHNLSEFENGKDSK